MASNLPLDTSAPAAASRRQPAPRPRPALGWLPGPLRGVVAGALLGANTLLWCSVLFALALVRLALPWMAVRRVLDPWLNRVATAWIAGNSGWMRLTQRTAWDVEGIDALPREGWYLVVANHQSWVDIFVLQHLLNRRIPLLKFFLKRQLIWVPVMGLAWWALDFPFMRRHSEAELARHPEKRLQDIEATKRACAKFALVPTSVMNFVEGTRFTPAKHAAQHSSFRHLLKPRAGGLAMAMNALGDRFDALLDVTIVYPDGAPTFWHFLRGDVPRIGVRAERRPIPHEVAEGDYAADAHYRKRVQRWLLGLWHAKDERIDELLRGES
jgi:1-acyl-sn-glycerol-3-phosphate acyltransferase